MLSFGISIRNPFSKDSDLKKYIYVCKSISKNKFLELEVYKCSCYNLIKFYVDLSWQGQDHAGPSLQIEVFGYCLDFDIRDYRHWDYKKGTWSEHDED